MKRIAIALLLVLLTFVVVTGLFGCGGGTQPDTPEQDEDTGTAEEIQTLTFSIASAYESDHVLVRVSEMIKELIEERSEGKITVNIFPGGVMGGEEDISEALTAGAVQMHASGGNPFWLYAPEYYFFDNPFILRDWDHLQRVWASEIGEAARIALLENGNTVHVGHFYRGMRHFTSNKPINNMDDLRGLKLRIPMLDTWVEIFNAAGVVPTPVPLHELYAALATGLVEASEGDTEQLWAFALYEVQDYISLTSHMVTSGHLTANAQWWNDLNEPTRNLILEAVKEASSWGTDNVIGRERELLERMRDEHGVTLVEDVDRDSIIEEIRPTLERLFEEFWVPSWDEVAEL